MSVKLNESTLSSAHDTASNLNRIELSDVGQHVYSAGDNGNLVISSRKGDHRASVKAHINRIPTELLIFIFKHFIDDCSSPAIGVLLFVCWQWYDLVESIPLLWSRISLSPKEGECNYEAYAKYIDKAAQKSQNLPLEIWVDFTHMSDESDPSVSDTYSPTGLLLRTVGEEGSIMRRWKTFSLRSKGKLYIKWGFWEELCYPAPLLQELYLHVGEAHSGHVSVPALRALVLDAPGRLGDIEFSPDTLETLCFRLWSAVGVLGPFVNLRSLAIDSFILGSEGDDYGEEPVQLPHLECLTIQWVNGWEFPVEMVQQIQAPALETLRLLGSMAIELGLEAACFQHVQDLQIVVEKVEASHKEIMGAAYLERELAAYASLKELTVARWHLEAAMEAIQGLQSKDKGPVLLKHIRTLDQDMKGDVITDDDSFSRVVVLWKATADFVYQYHNVAQSLTTIWILNNLSLVRRCRGSCGYS